MLDIIAAVTLTFLAFSIPAGLLAATPLGGAARGRIAAVLLAWFVLLIALGATGLFATANGGTPAIGAAVVLPIIAGLIAARYSAAVRAFIAEVPLSGLAVIHVGRLFAIFFLLLYAEARLPQTFALVAGWGDIVIAVAAPFVAWAVYRRAAGARGLALTWNTLGIADLIMAVTFGVGSAVDSPVRFLYEAASSGTMSLLPWLIVPGFMVPLYLMTHLTIFRRLFRRREMLGSLRLSGAI